MPMIRIVSGTGTGPTELAAYDTALADAGIHNYNLITVSSMIPMGSRIEVLDSAPDLGPAGEKLTVVEACKTVEADATACAALGWTLDDADRGLFYEASGTDLEAVEEMVGTGLAAGRELRDWSFADERIATAESDPTTDDGYTTALVAGIYGESEPIA